MMFRTRVGRACLMVGMVLVFCILVESLSGFAKAASLPQTDRGSLSGLTERDSYSPASRRDPSTGKASVSKLAGRATTFPLWVKSLRDDSNTSVSRLLSMLPASRDDLWNREIITNGPFETNVSVVFCHGSFARPVLFKPIIDVMKSIGVGAYCPSLPTCNITNADVRNPDNPAFDQPPPESGWPTGYDDANEIVKLLETLINDQKHYVILVGHSYGGWVASQAAKSEFNRAKRMYLGQRGGLLGIVYMAGIIPLQYNSPVSFIQALRMRLGAAAPMFTKWHAPGARGLITPVDTHKYFFNTLDATDSDKWTSLLTAQPLPMSNLTNDGFAAYPKTYLYAKDDRTLPRSFIESQIPSPAWANVIKTYEVDSGHLMQVENPVDAALAISDSFKHLAAWWTRTTRGR